MQLKPFLLNMWLDHLGHDITFNLGSSTGPSWTVEELLELADGDERQRFYGHALTYSQAVGSAALREAIVAMHGVGAECVQIVTGASEALLIMMWLAAEPGANVVLPRPGYTAFSALPESLGIETRFYSICKENSFRIDVGAIMELVDNGTKVVVVNSPHNPTGATMSDAEMEQLHEFTSARGIQLVSDEVYHPIYYGKETRSASRLPHATVIADFSKAFSLPGLRTGWIIEHDPQRRERYWNARAYFSASNTPGGEMLGTIAIRRRDVVLKKTLDTAKQNLQHLDKFMARHHQTLGWVRPQGGVTAFPWLLSGENARPFCLAAADCGILLAPGDCFDAPSHFRIGFAAAGHTFPEGLDRLSELMDCWPATRRS